MWRNVHGSERKKYLEKAIEFTGNARLYGEYMMKAIEQWPMSCEHNLTDQSMNKQAWVGHAACCIALGCPEDITREAWHYLTQEQQDEANAMADLAIAKWQESYLRGKTGQLTLW